MFFGKECFFRKPLQLNWILTIGGFFDALKGSVLRDRPLLNNNLQNGENITALMKKTTFSLDKNTDLLYYSKELI